jgi:hypothetical protein
LELVWRAINKELPETGRECIYVPSSLTDVGHNLEVTSSDYIRYHPEQVSWWAYVNYPAAYLKMFYDRINSEYGIEHAEEMAKREAERESL